jgi:mRNA capping enzyme, beta chain
MRKTLNSSVKITTIPAVGESSHSLKKESTIIFKMDRALMAEWTVPINMYKDRKNVEIEWRMGRSGKTFDTNVGKDVFDRTLRRLQKYTEWEETKEGDYTVYYGPNNKRITIDESNDEQTCIYKNKIVIANFPMENQPFDIRLAVSEEKPVDWGDETEATSSKSKKRWSFIRKNLSIDLSIMKGDPDDKDTDNDITYHIELEIVDPTKISSDDELYKILYKTFDLMKIM